MVSTQAVLLGTVGTPIIIQYTERRIIMNGKKLYKIKNGAMLTGVCNGLAAYFDVDVSLVRVATVLAVCFTGVGFVAYIAAALILPEVENSPYVNSGNANNAGNYNTNDTFNANDAANNGTDDNGKDIL